MILQINNISFQTKNEDGVLPSLLFYGDYCHEKNLAVVMFDFMRIISDKYSENNISELNTIKALINGKLYHYEFSNAKKHRFDANCINEKLLIDDEFIFDIRKSEKYNILDYTEFCEYFMSKIHHFYFDICFDDEPKFYSNDKVIYEIMKELNTSDDRIAQLVVSVRKCLKEGGVLILNEEMDLIPDRIIDWVLDLFDDAKNAQLILFTDRSKFMDIANPEQIYINTKDELYRLSNNNLDIKTSELYDSGRLGGKLNVPKESLTNLIRK